MSEPSFLGGNTPRRTDTRWVIDQKILGAIRDDISNSGNASDAHFSGSGSPEGVVTAGVGALYYDTANGMTYYKMTGTGNTGWQ